MDDLISRQALCEYALNQKDKSVTPNDIMRFPSAEPERKTGHWVITSKFDDCYYAHCDQCNITQVFYFGKPTTNYCPNCGSYNGGQDETD